MYGFVKLGKKLYMTSNKVEGRELMWNRMQVLRCKDAVDKPWVGESRREDSGDRHDESGSGTEAWRRSVQDGAACQGRYR